MYLIMCNLIIRLGRSATDRLPPRRIIEIREVDVPAAQALGAPSGKAFEDLFGPSCKSILAIHFEQVQPHEVPENLRQMKKSTEALGRLKALSAKPRLVGKEKTLEKEGLDQMFKPSESRRVRDPQEEKSLKKQPIQIPSNLLKRFIEHAWPHSPREFMAWITGRIEVDKESKKEISYADGLFFPKQTGSLSDVVEVDDGTSSQALVKYCEETGCQLVGWIHSHPTFSAFFSSVDQHMMWKLQKDVPLAYGLVIDEKKQARCLRLSPAGMKCIEECEDNPQVPIAG